MLKKEFIHKNNIYVITLAVKNSDSERNITTCITCNGESFNAISFSCSYENFLFSNTKFSNALPNTLMNVAEEYIKNL